MTNHHSFIFFHVLFKMPNKYEQSRKIIPVIYNTSHPELTFLDSSCGQCLVRLHIACIIIHDLDFDTPENNRNCYFIKSTHILFIFCSLIIKLSKITRVCLPS